MKHTFLKHALWAALFAAGAAMAQDAAISGADFTHGKADAQLAAIGSHAAADGQTVVVTAPTYWQAKVAAKIRAGAHGQPLTIRFSNGFYENVLVRTETAAVAEAEVKPASVPVAKAEAKPEPKLVRKAEPRAKREPAAMAKAESRAKSEPKPTMAAGSKPGLAVASESKPEPAPRPAVTTESKPEPAPGSAVAAATVDAPAKQPNLAAAMPMRPAARQVPASAPPEPAPQAASNIVAVPQVSNQPAVVPIPTTAINAPGVQPVTPASPQDASARQHMLAALNDGRPAMGSLTEGELQPGDQVYTEGETLAVIRLEGLHRSLYWLRGRVDLQRVQYMPQPGGSYAVTGTIDPKAPAAHRSVGGAHVIVVDVPAEGSAARARLEQRYNNGQPITRNLRAAGLQPEDRLLVDGGTIVVARREGNSMGRYWLTGSIDLGQTGIQKLEGNVYRVTGSNLH